MSGIVGSKFNHRGSGLVGSLGTDGQHLLSSGAGKKHVFETVAAAESYDDEPIKSDITALALREATNATSAAFNLPSSFIETFTDDTNLGTQTDCDRSSGYMETAAAASDSNCQLLLHMEDTDLTDSSPTGHTTTLTGNVARSSTQAKFGTYSMTSSSQATGDNLGVASSSDWQFGTGDATVEFWVYHTAITSEQFYVSTYNGSAGFGIRSTSSDLYLNTNTAASGWFNEGTFAHGMSTDTWHHVAVVWEGGATIKTYVDGVLKDTWTVAYINDTASTLYIGGYSGVFPTGFMDEVRISKGLARYTSAFTPPTTALVGTVTTINATGTLIQSANAVTGSRTKVGGTFLYKDNEGTATLGSANDLAIYFTCDGGSNWTEAASYNAITPVYSTGVKQVRLGETTCTGGTDVRYKAVWNNQSGGSLETQLHGIGINY
jgi:hypothetical protein